MTNEKKFILISIEDDLSRKIAGVLGSKTSKKIIDLLAENLQLSEKDISNRLNIPLNTVEYNLKKLVACEMIEKAKDFFWSRRGKKIVMYRLSNKSIIISPKTNKISSKIRTLLPVFLVSGIGAFLIKLFSKKTSLINDVEQSGALLFSTKGASELALTPPTPSFISLYSTQPWIWFLAGSLLITFLFAILNWKKL
jgi:DNA-binding transcriptional ArsR family regulator